MRKPINHRFWAALLPLALLLAPLAAFGACTYSLDHSSISFNTNGGSDSILLTADAGCDWGVVNTNDWLTITSATNGTGSGTISYTVAVNPTAFTRMGVVTIADQSLTVSQDAAPCTFSLAFGSMNYGPGTASDSVDLTTPLGCVWAVASGANWITIQSAANNTNNGTVNYSLAANPTHLARTGTVMIADQVLTISQDPASCTYSLGFNSANYGQAAFSDTVNVGTLTGCVWTATSAVNWITVTGSTSNSPTNGTISYTVSANPTHLTRSGTINISGQVLTITQDPASCSYTLGFSSTNYGFGAISDTVSVGTVTGCVVTAVSGTNWITVTSITSNSPSSSTIAYTVSANPTHLTRSGSINISGQVLAITQDPAPCSYTLGFTSTNYGFGAISDTVSVGTVTGCIMTAVSGTNWITVTSTTSNNPSSSIVAFTVSANPTHLARSGTISISGQVLTITQDPAPCSYSLGFSSTNYGFGAISDTVSVGTVTGCVVTAVSGTNWITVTSTTSNNPSSSIIAYTVSANPTHLARSGTINIGGQVLTITQDPAGCSYTLGFTSTNYGFGAISDTVGVGTVTGCVVTAVSGTNWITVTSTTSNSPSSSTVAYTVSANPSHLARSGTINISGQVLTITQDPAPCSYTLGFSSTNYGFGGISDTVSVGTVTGCVVTAVSGTNWITVTSTTSNSPSSSTVAYTVSANPTHLTRSGTINISGQILTITQDPAGCNYTLGFTSTNYGFGGISDNVSVGTVTGCVVTAVSGSNWITVTSNTSNSPSSSTVAYSVAANPTHLTRSGAINISGQVLTITQDPAPCSYTLGFTSTNYGFGGISDTVSVGTVTGCVVTAVSGTNWITVTSTTSNSPSSSTVAYTVSANPTHLTRSGTINISGQILTITQDPAGCNYTLGFTSTNYGFGGISDTVSVGTVTGCVVTAVSGTNWITVTSTTSNSPSSSTIAYAVSANPTHLARSGTINISGQVLTITQDPAPCSYSLGFTSTNYGFGAISDTVSVGTVTGCVVSAVSGTNWITVTSTTSNSPSSSTVAYTVSANSTHLARTGTVTIASQVLTISQDPAPCTYTLGFNTTNYGPASISDTVSVGTLTGCVWTATSGANWINVTGTTGNSPTNGTVRYTVSANPTHLARTGTVTIASQVLTISQDPAPCTYTLGFNSTNYSPASISGTVSVGTLTGCVWTAASGVNWIAVTGSTSNSPTSGTVSYTVSANPTHLARTGTVSIASQILTISQDPAPCTYTLGFTSMNYGPASISDTVSVGSLTGCVWTAASGVNWIAIIGSTSNSPTNGTVSYTVSANPTHLARTGTVTIASQVLTISQDPAACSYNLGFNGTNYGPASISDTVSVGTLTGCVWTATSGVNWITVTGSASNSPASGTASYTVSANPAHLARTGTVTIASQVLTISQDPAPCTYTLGFNSTNYGFGAISDVVSVGTVTGCVMTAVSGTNWITITSTTSNSPSSSTVAYTVSANPTHVTRSGTINISGQLLTITQDPAGCSYTLGFTSTNYGVGAISDTVNVGTVTGCVVTAVSGTNWITVTSTTSNNPSSSTVAYTVSANPTHLTRSGTINISGQLLTITQDPAACSYALAFTSTNYAFGAISDTVSVGTVTGCMVTAVSGTNWIAVTSTSSNSPSSSTVAYTVSANPTHLPRSGTIDISGQILTITQDPAPCNYTLGFTSTNYGFGGISDTVSVGTVTGCVVTAVSGTNWITVTSITSNSPSSSTIAYTVSANPTHLTRSGTINISGQVLMITQDPAPCSYTLGFTSTNYGFGAISDTVSVGTVTGCVVTAVSGTNWITVTSTTSNSSSSSTIAYTVSANPTHLTRSGSINISGQVLTITQDPASCSYTLGYTSTNYGFEAISDTVSVGTVTGCVVTAVSGTNWITVTSTTSNSPSSSTIAYSVSVNPTHLTRSGTINISGQILTITQDPAGCSYTLGFASTNYGFGVISDTVSVGTLTGCVVTAVSGTNWITVTSTTSNNPSSSTVAYTVSANPTHLARSGTINISGQILTITQDPAGCSYTLGFTSANYGFGAISDTVSVGTVTGCVVTAVSGTNWITVTSTTSNSPSSSTVAYTVSANPSHLARSGTINISGQVLTITQDPAPCSYTLGFTSTNYGFGGISDTVSVGTVTGCVVTAVSGTNWITVTSTTSNSPSSSTVAYTVSANPTHLTRSGTINISGQILTITQDPAGCSYTLGFTSTNYGFGGISDTVSVGTVTGCVVTAASGTNWIAVTSTTSNSPSISTVAYTVSANPTHLTRSGTINISGQVLTITQDPAACTYTLGFNSTNYGPASTSGTVSVGTLTGCVWTATSGINWITVTGTTSNSPTSGTVSYTVSANPTHLARTGTVTIASQILTISQDPTSCTYTLGFNSTNYGPASISDTVSVGTLTGCVWTAISGVNWIAVTGSASNSPASGIVSYTVSANPTHLARTGTVTIASQVLTITQDPAACTYTLGFNSTNYGPASISGTVSVSTLTGCVWTATSGVNWITVTGSTGNSPSSGSVSYSVSANPTHLARTGTVTIASQILTISQDPAACTYTLGFNSTNYGPASTSGTVSVGTLTGCVWTATSGVNWITVTGSTSNSPTSGTTSYTVSANPTHLARTGTVTIASQILTLSQDPAACTYTLGFNSANYGPASITDTVSVGTLTGCVWTAVSGVNWISVTGSASNTPASGTVSYTVSANPTHLARTGTVTIASQVLTITQDPAGCTYTLGFNSTNYGPASVSDTVSVGTLTGCVWTAVSGVNWIAVTGSASNTPASGTVSYTVSANPTHLARTGTVTIASQTLTISQDPAACTYTLGFNSTNYGPASISDTVSVGTLTGCVWTAVSGVNWINVTGTTSNSPASGAFRYTVSANPAHLTRTGTVTIANQVLTISQDPAPCAFSLGFNSVNYGFGTNNDQVNLTTLLGCTWSVSSGASWITINSSANNTNSGSVGYAVAPNPAHLPRTGTVAIADQVLVVSQDPAPCNYSLSPSNWIHRAISESGQVSVTTLLGCSWSVLNTNNWITITSSSSGSNSGSFSYTVAANSGAGTRTGVIAVADQFFTVAQVGTACTYKLSPTNRFHGFGAATNSFSVTAGSGCAWSVITTNDWITIQSSPTGTGNGTISYALTANRNPNPRAGAISVAGEVFTLTQWGTNCAFSLSPPSLVSSYSGVSTVVNFTASSLGCPWNVINTNSWITLNSASSGTGSGSVSYTVAFNLSPNPRTGTLNIGGETLTVSQGGFPCAYALSATSATYSFGATNDQVAVTASNLCPWAVINTNTWITITSSTNDLGSDTVIFTVDANPTGIQRNGLVLIADQSFAITQDGIPCTFSLSSTNNSYGPGSGTGGVTLTSVPGCSWFVNNSNNWIMITSGTSGTGSGDVGYAVDANPTGLARTGTVAIADQLLTVIQAASPCVFAIVPTNRVHGGGLETGAVSVVTLSGCGWTVNNTNAWVTINSGTSGSGNASVAYTVAPNPSLTGRTGVVMIAGQLLTLRQAGAACSFTLSPTNRAHGSGVETAQFSVTTLTGCNWSVNNTNNWITINSSLNNSNNGNVNYTVASNPSINGRSGVIWIQNQPFTVTQAGFTCAYALSPTNRVHGSGPETGQVSVTTSNACSWVVINTNSWVFITGNSNGTGNGTVSYSVTTNAGPSRSGNLLIGGVPFGISQNGGQRFVRAADMAIQRGQTNRLLFVLESLGNENAVGFSFNYDTNLLTFIKAVKSPAVTDPLATLIVNTNQAFTNARVGCVFGLSPDVLFSAGPNTFVEASFRAAPGTTFTTTTVTFGDIPVARDVTDALGNPLPASFSSATVTLLGVCTYSIATNGNSFTATGGSGSIAVTADLGCAWSTLNTNNWISITSGATGAGNGSVAYTVAPNPNAFPRTGQFTAAGQTFTVNQDAAACTFTISPTNWNHGAGMETGLVAVTTLPGCSWAASNANTWITLGPGSNSIGSGSVSYTVSPNPSSIPRAGVMMIAGQLFTINQGGATCTFSILPHNAVHGSGVETGSVAVTTLDGCNWTVQNTNGWVTILSSPSGISNGTVLYNVTANPTLNARAGVLTIAGQPFTISQLGADCAYTISPTNFVYGYGQTNGLASVTTSSNGCGWSVVNTNPWVTITSGSSGIGNGTVAFSVAANPLGTTRIGLLNIGGQYVKITQAASPCVFSLVPTSRSHGFGQETGQVSVTVFSSCGWSVNNTNGWINITSSITNNTGAGTVTYVVVPNPSGLARAGFITIADQLFAVSQAPAPCNFTLNPLSVSYGPGSTNGSLNVTSLAGCAWTATNLNNWINITSPTNGAGNGSVTYTVLANPTSIGRTGVLMIANQTFTVSQAGSACTFSISPSSQGYGPGITSDSVNLTTIGGCKWGVTNNNNWVAITSSTSNNIGSGVVSYTILANPTGLGRTGVVTIAGQTLTIGQAPAACTYSIPAASVSYQFATTNDSTSVSTLPGCNWDVVNTNGWIFITSTASNNIGSGTVSYVVTNNPTSIPRTGVVVIAGQLLTVGQSGTPCSFSLTQSNWTHGAGSETGIVAVTAVTGCDWQTVNTNSWITLISGTNGPGSASLTYSVDPNPTPNLRVGVITIANIPFTVTQLGFACLYSIAPSNHVHGSGTEAGLVSVNASNGCPWTVSETNSWIVIKSATNGTGVGTVRYTVLANPDPGARTGFITIAGQLYTVIQLGSPCSYSLLPTNHVHGSGSETGLVSVLTAPGCPWTVDNTNAWITIVTTIGTGSGSVGYTVDANLTPNDRTAVITIANLPYIVMQLGAACSYTLTPTNGLQSYGPATGQVAVTTFNGCAWTATKTNTWITLGTNASGVGPGGFTYTLATNPTAIVRSGVITVFGQPYFVTQAGTPCTYAISLTNRLHGAGLETGVVSVASVIGCTWTVANTNSWITFPAGTNYTGSTNVVYTVGTNPVAFPRTGQLTIAGLPYTVSQLAATCVWALTPTNRSHGFAATNGTVAVSTITGCTWAVDNSNSWITITSSITNITNSGTVSYSITANPTGLSRTGPVTIAGQLFTLTQSPAPCTFAISPTNRVHSSGLETNSVSVITLVGCPWTVNNTNSWILVTSGTNGVGSGSVNYTVNPNPNPGPRIGVMTIAGQSFTITNLAGVSMVCVPNKNVECGSFWDFDPPTATSSCGGTNVRVLVVSTVTNATGMCGSTFTATRIWQGTDVCSNVASCSQTVRIVDTTPPTVICPANKIVESGSAWTFDLPTGSDTCNGTNVIIPQVLTTVTNTTGFCGNTFVAIRTWQLSDSCSNRVQCSQTVTVMDTTPPLLICPGDKGIVCGTVWSFDSPIAVDLPSGTTITNIVILGTVTNGSCGPTFSAMRTWKATDACGNISTCTQTITNTQAIISGTVYVPTTYPPSAQSGKPVAAVPLSLGGDAAQSTQTISDGTFNFHVTASGNFSVTPTPPGSGPVANGVTTVDISLIRRHILNIALLDSPYKLLAADVNGSRSVSTLDISWIRKMVLGVTNVFPAGLWRFIPSDYVLDPVNPWDAPAVRSYTNLLVDTASQDFVAIKLGDVNSSWTPPVAAQPLSAKSLLSISRAPRLAASAAASSGPEVTFQLNQQTNQPGQTITAQVSVSGFRQVTSVQFTLAWDPAVLEYEDVGGFTLQGLSASSFGTLLTNAGRLCFSWDDPAAAGVSLDDGTAIFTVEFKVIGGNGAVSLLDLVDAVTEREVGVNFASANFRSISGQVTVASTAASLPSPVKLSRGVYTLKEFSLPLTTVKGLSYILEYSDALPTTNWIALPAVVGDGTVKTLTDPAATPKQRFYRLRIE